MSGVEWMRISDVEDILPDWRNIRNADIMANWHYI